MYGSSEIYLPGIFISRFDFTDLGIEALSLILKHGLFAELNANALKEKEQAIENSEK